MAETLRATLLTLIQDLNPSLPLLLLATSEQPYNTLDPVVCIDMFPTLDQGFFQCRHFLLGREVSLSLLLFPPPPLMVEYGLHLIS